MRLVSYTRTTSCYPGAEIPPDVITAQNGRIKKYAEQHGWKIMRRYSDRKKDAEENAAFAQLLNDGMRREFDAVIVDSVYRAGKDLWTAKEVLLQTFHYAGIWFVVAEDDYASIDRPNSEAEAYFAKKYGAFRRESIRHRALSRNRSGILSWSDAKYGYRLTDDYRLVRDERTAPVVERIFQMCAAGMSPRDVAAVLSEEKIPSPLAMRGTNTKAADPYKWTGPGIREMLGRTAYVGHWTKMVQGEEIKISNEPIITEELFREAQKVIKTPGRAIKKPVGKHRYAGIVCDSEDGFCFRYREGTEGGYFVSTCRKGSAHLFVDKVDLAVTSALGLAKSRALEILAKIRSEGADRRNSRMEDFIGEYRRRAFALAEGQEKRMGIYQKLSHGMISAGEAEDYFLLARKSVERQEAYFATREKFLKRTELLFSEANPWLRLYLSWEPGHGLDKDTIKKYVSKIVVEQMATISVMLNWSAPIF